MDDIKEQTRLLRQIRLALQNNDYAAAIQSLEEAVQLAHEGGDVSAEGRHLGNLALIHYRLGHTEQALECFGRALVRARTSGDRVTEDGLLGNMGNILRELKRYDEAVSYLNMALLIAQEIGDVRGRGIWLGNLGLVYDDLQQPEQAVELHEQSVLVARQLNDQRGLASRLGNLGNSYVALGDYKQALRHFEEAAPLYEQLGDQRELALRLGIIGNLYAAIGRQVMPDPTALIHFSSALNYYQRTLALARQLDDRAGEAELLRSIGNVLANMGQYDQSIEYLELAAEIFQAMGLSQQEAETRQTREVVLSHRKRAGRMKD